MCLRATRAARRGGHRAAASCTACVRGRGGTRGEGVRSCTPPNVCTGTRQRRSGRVTALLCKKLQNVHHGDTRAVWGAPRHVARRTEAFVVGQPSQHLCRKWLFKPQHHRLTVQDQLSHRHFLETKRRFRAEVIRETRAVSTCLACVTVGTVWVLGGTQRFQRKASHVQEPGLVLTPEAGLSASQRSARSSKILT